MSLPDKWVREPLVRHIEFPEGQVDPRRPPYRDWPLIAPDHIESRTGRLLSIQTAAQQNAISGKYTFRRGDVLYSKIRPYLRKAALADFEGLCSADMYPLRPKSSLDSRFLLALILGEDFSRFAEAVSMRSGFPKINREEFAEHEAFLPPIDEQRQIADVLGAADATIRQTEAFISKLRQMKAGLLHDLLTRGLDEQGHLRHPQSDPELFKESLVGRIPIEWEFAPLGNLVSLTEYGISVPLFEAGRTPVLRMNNLSEGHINLSELRYSDSDEARDTLLQRGDVLFNRTNSIDHVGRTSIWEDDLPSASFASYCVRFRVVEGLVDPGYLVYYMNLPASQLAIKRLSTPAVQQVNVNPTRLKERLLIAFPSDLREQRDIVARLREFEVSLRIERIYCEKIKSQKRGLMHDLLTARVRV